MTEAAAVVMMSESLESAEEEREAEAEAEEGSTSDGLRTMRGAVVILATGVPFINVTFGAGESGAEQSEPESLAGAAADGVVERGGMSGSAALARSGRSAESGGERGTRVEVKGTGDSGLSGMAVSGKQNG